MNFPIESLEIQNGLWNGVHSVSDIELYMAWPHALKDDVQMFGHLYGHNID